MTTLEATGPKTGGRSLQISLSHFNSDVFFIGPESLRRSWYTANFPTISNTYFPDSGFANRRRYSRWMMKGDLYDHFLNYEFLPICQTDAVVTKPFPNELLKGFDFDYAGAPWVPGYYVSWNPLSGLVGEDASRITKRWIQVGNGGLSLRRVRAFRRATRLLPRVRGRENEDKVFSYFSRLITLKVASRQVAGSLFMEQEAKDWKPDQPLPSVHGFHALDRFNPALEAEVFKLFGQEY